MGEMLTLAPNSRIVPEHNHPHEHMGLVLFHIAGEDAKRSGLNVDVSTAQDLDKVRKVVASQFAIVEPDGVEFMVDGRTIDDVADLKSVEEPVSVWIDGHQVRDAPGPHGLPYLGSFFEVYPDHLENNQKLFSKYGPVVKYSSMGQVLYQTNDPEIGRIAFSESEFFSKEINSDHPLYLIKSEKAGVFLGDTNSASWRIVHKFMPPALGPKAVRHYAPKMNGELRNSLPVFDELQDKGEAWNVYHYMLKLSSATVAKIVLGKDLQHFSSPEAPLAKIVSLMAENLALNKKISSVGEWYSHLPFGDPKRQRDVQMEIFHEINSVIQSSKSGGTEDLPLQDAALTADNVIDYFVRAVDGAGEHLPTRNLISSVIVAAGAGFTTTSSLLSWLIYGLVTYPGSQNRLVQELVDLGYEGDDISPAMLEKMPQMDKYVKETQRRHNPSYQPARTAQRDLILPGGIKMPKGAVMVVGLHHIHMNPKVWDNPDRFDPDRWDTDQVKQRGKTDYMPFAVGQRSCIGFNFALQEVKIFLAHLVWRYEWFKEGDTETEYDPYFQLIRPVNLYVKTKRRTGYPSRSDQTQS